MLLGTGSHGSVGDRSDTLVEDKIVEGKCKEIEIPEA